MRKMEQDNLISVKKLIGALEDRDIRIGRPGSDPYNTLRYYTKIGLLPHMTRQFSEEENSVVGHYPIEVIERLKRIETLKEEGYTNQEIREKLGEVSFVLEGDSLIKKGVRTVTEFLIFTRQELKTLSRGLIIINSVVLLLIMVGVGVSSDEEKLLNPSSNPAFQNIDAALNIHSPNGYNTLPLLVQNQENYVPLNSRGAAIKLGLSKEQNDNFNMYEEKLFEIGKGRNIDKETLEEFKSTEDLYLVGVIRPDVQAFQEYLADSALHVYGFSGVSDDNYSISTAMRGKANSITTVGGGVTIGRKAGSVKLLDFGEGVISVGENQSIVDTHISFESGSEVIITPAEPLPYTLGVEKSVEKDDFTVKAPQRVTENIRFAWLIVK